MSNHLPTQTNPGVYHCPCCGFYAVQVGDGLHVIDSGIGRALHLEALGQAMVDRAAYVEQLRRNLIARWESSPPGALGLLNRLVKHIEAEYGI